MNLIKRIFFGSLSRSAIIKSSIKTYVELCASFQDSLFDGFDFVAGQVQHLQVAESLELDRGENRIQRVAQ
jgi:hypothetical protein